ncbi:MAG: HEAT repeat domain-containing protein [Bradymonadia bacterium]
MEYATDPETLPEEVIRGVLSQWAELGALVVTGAQDEAQAMTVARGLVQIASSTGLVLLLSPNTIQARGHVVFEAPLQQRNYLPYILFRHGIRRLSFDSTLTSLQARALIDGYIACLSPGGGQLDLSEVWSRASVQSVRWLTVSPLGERAILGEPKSLEAMGTMLKRLTGLGEPLADRLMPSVTPLQEDPFETEALLPAEGPQIAEALIQAEERSFPDEVAHLVHLLACFALRAPSPLGVKGLSALISRLLVETAIRRHWNQYAAVCRTLQALCGLKQTQSSAVLFSLEAVERALVSAEVIEALALYLDDERDFNLWIRWFFATEEYFELDGVVETLAVVPEGPGRNFLRDLLHQQGLGSLERWSERLKSGAIDEAFELLRLLEKGALGDGGTVLLRLALRHTHRDVRTQAAQALARRRPGRLVDWLVPLLHDPEAMVRRSAARGLVEAGGREAAEALGRCILEDVFEQRPASERRALCEALGALGGPEAMRTLSHKINPVEHPWAADDPRWPAVYGLVRLGPPGRIMVDQIKRHVSTPESEGRLRHALSSIQEPPWVVPLKATPFEVEPISRDTLAFIDGEQAMGEGLIFDPQTLVDAVIPPPKIPRQVEVSLEHVIEPDLASLDEMVFDESVWAVEQITHVELEEEETAAEASPGQGASEVSALVSAYLESVQTPRTVKRPAEQPDAQQSLPDLLKSFLEQVDD